MSPLLWSIVVDELLDRLIANGFEILDSTDGKAISILVEFAEMGSKN